VTYAGAAPGAVAGILQINFAAPPQSSTVELQVGAVLNSFPVAVQ
jgi:hypothetical protein